MPNLTLGNMSQFFQTQRHNLDLKTRLNTLSQELSSGKKSDLTRSLGTDATRFSHISRRLDLLTSYQTGAEETAQFLVITQTALSSLGEMRSSLSSDLLAADFSDSAAQRQSRMEQAKSVFKSMVSTLNARYADRNVMSGTATNSAALAPAEDILASLETAVAGLSNSVDIRAALDLWFDDPSGGFATMGYTGDTGDLAATRIDETETVTFNARADKQEIRDVLKAAATAFVGMDLGLDDDVEAELIREGGLGLATAGEALTHLAATVGATEARVAEILVRQEAEASSLSLLYNDLTSADPFETATQLQELQVQLETHYTVTARLSRLSLAEYL